MRRNDDGTVLITTLLIMAVMAAITVALMDDIRVAVKRTININAYAQADWQARGAEDYIRAYIETEFATLDPLAQSALLRSETPLVLPTPEGAITLRLKDASHCVNLNGAVQENGAGEGRGRLRFVTLAQTLGLPDNQAVALGAALTDWLDSDQQLETSGAEDGTYLRRNPPYRTADAPMTGPEELRALDGMDEDLWELFRPFVCTGGAGLLPPVNLNTLEPERLVILAAALGGPDAIPAAQSLLRERPLQGYSEAALLPLFERFNIDPLQVSNVGTQADAIFVEVVSQAGPAERARSFRFDGLIAGAPELTYRGWGRETFRPEIEAPAQTGTDTEAPRR